MRLVITGGQLVTGEGSFRADVAVEDGIVTGVGEWLAREGDDVFDASGHLVLPGCIDIHTHLEAPHNDLEAPSQEALTCDDFRSGTIAAAVGGTTTIIDFATQNRGRGFSDTLQEWKGKLLARPPAVDVGLHMIVTDLSFDGAEDDLAGICEEGVTSFKVFLAYKESPLWIDDTRLFKVASVAARAGAIVLAHAENGGAIEVLQRDALERGDTAAIWHALTRPPATEAEAINRVASLCAVAGAPAFIMHVSCQEAVDTILRAKGSGQQIWAETCPQYLAFDEDVLRQEHVEAAKYVYTPPPRAAGQPDALWRALRGDALSVVSTDHCPYLTKWKAAAPDFFSIPNGAPGIENRLEVMYELGVRQERLDVVRLVNLLATTPARLFGLFPKKGTIAPGSDADIVLFDPNRGKVISAAEQMSRCDYTLYEGMEVAGSVNTVFFRGSMIVSEGRYRGLEESGRFLPRSRFARPSVTSAVAGP